MKKKKLSFISCICWGILVLALTGCGSSGENADADGNRKETRPVIVNDLMNTAIFADSGLRTFEVTSEDLHDGVWDSIITNTDNGSNVSPQLSWEAVPEAGCYVIYMVDTSAGNWIHWKSNNVTETSLPQGWAPEGEYIGPYPPSGTHDYKIYVVAIKEPVERAKGAFNSTNEKFKSNVMSMDATTEGASGNILAYGEIVGTYTHGEE